MMRPISPAMEKYAQIQQTLQGGDPIEAGAFKGIEAAKSSLSLMPLMRQPMIQQPPIYRAPPAARALSAGAGAFKPPMPGTGRAGMLQSIAQSMGPAMQAYNQEMDTRNALEMEMAAAEQKQRNEMEDQAYKMLHLAESERHNRAAESENALDRAARYSGNAQQFTKEGIDISNYPNIPKGAMAKINKEKNSFASVVKDIQEMKDLRTKLQEISKGSTISPGNPYIGRAANVAKDVYGYMGSSADAKKQREETLIRQELQRKADAFKAKSENALKGGGQLAIGMLKIMDEYNLYPKANEPDDVFWRKVSALEKEILPKYGALKDSVQYQKFIDPIEYEYIHGESEESKAKVSGKKWTPEEEEIAKQELANGQ